MIKLISLVVLNFIVAFNIFSQDINGKKFNKYSQQEQIDFNRYASNKDTVRQKVLLKVYDVILALHFSGHKYTFISKISALVRGSKFEIINLMVDGDIADIIILKFENRKLVSYSRKKERL